MVAAERTGAKGKRPEAMQNLAVVGAGAWGTALAQTAARAGRRVTLWARERATVAEISRTQRNTPRLPGIDLDRAIAATANLDDVAAADAVLLAVPAQTVREVAARLPGSPAPVVICAKGLEQTSGLRLTEVLAAVCPGRAVAVLSGPNFAREVAQGRPAASALATPDRQLGGVLAAALSSRHFRVYWTDDVVGVEVGGAVKNVIAIAAGIVMGLDLGENARAGLITRGLAELARLGEALGARRETLAGLSGLGDVVLTCTSLASRNTSFGHALGAGAEPGELRRRQGPLAEGVSTARAVVRLAERLGVDMPIAHAVDDVLCGHLRAADAVERLMRRPLRAETSR